jgi:hypothetical protein
MREPYEDTNTLGTRRSRKVSLLLLSAAVVALGAFAVWLSPGGNAGLKQGTGLVRTETGNPGTVGTSGTLPDGAEQASVPLAGSIIHDLETITGANDGHELVGRRVDLHVPVSHHINDVVFWVGASDNRLLVVLARDDRDGAERQRGEPSNSSINSLRAGQQATISGSIERVPYAEAMYSWGLTNADRAELMERRIYLRANTVRPAVN